jgi:replicative DNA helicase
MVKPLLTEEMIQKAAREKRQLDAKLDAEFSAYKSLVETNDSKKKKALSRTQEIEKEAKRSKAMNKWLVIGVIALIALIWAAFKL